MDVPRILNVLKTSSECLKNLTASDSERSNANQAAKKALKELSHILDDTTQRKQFSIESLLVIYTAINNYQDAKELRNENKPNIFQIRPANTTEKKVNKKILGILSRIESKVNKLITDEVDSWKSLRDWEIENNLRKLVMKIASGEATGNFLAIQTAIDKIYYLIDDDRVKNLCSSIKFHPCELKTGVLLTNDPTTIEDSINNAKKVIAPSDRSSPPEVLAKQRLFRLNHLREIYKQIPQDGSQSVKSKFFPQTTAWYVGSCIKNDQAPFELEMQVIGEEYGITVISDSRLSTFDSGSNTRVLSEDTDAAYPQDFVDCSLDEMRIPPMGWGVIFLQTAIYEGRANRDSDWTITQLEDGTPIPVPKESIPSIGAVLTSDQSMKAIGLASALGVTPVLNLTYSEGGNTLIGSREDGTPYIIIGKDSWAVSKAFMEADLGRKMTKEEIMMAFAIDYGISIDQIFFVEQPGDFHLDMNMAILGPNTIALNDSEAAEAMIRDEWVAEMKESKLLSEVQIAELEKRCKLKAKIKKKFEDKTEQDLKKLGFTVIRVPGNVARPSLNGPEFCTMNFFNMVTARTGSGENILIAMSIPEKYGQEFEEMTQKMEPIPNKKYFLNRESTLISLRKHGGISCRTKTLC